MSSEKCKKQELHTLREEASIQIEWEIHEKSIVKDVDGNCRKKQLLAAVARCLCIYVVVLVVL